MTRSFPLWGLLALLLFALSTVPTVLGSPPTAGPVQVEATLTETAGRVGDQIGLRLSVTHHYQTRIDFPTLRDKLGTLEVLGAKLLPPTRYLDGSQVSVMEYTITGFLPGRHDIPPLSISYVDPQGERGTIVISPSLTLEVTSVLANLADETIRDIKPPVTIPPNPASYAYTAGLLTLGVGVLGLSVMLYRRWPRGLHPRFLPARALTPEEEARQELNRIATLDLPERMDFAPYYSLISTCIRRYVDARLGLDALGSTTSELRKTMERREVDRWLARVVNGLLEECDAAKWAHYEPASARAARALTIAFEILELIGGAERRAGLDGALPDTTAPQKA